MQNYPEWYQSSTGPGISKTIINIVGNVIPILNLVLASKGINILPEAINDYVSLAVFLYFSVQAGIGYIRSKKILGQKVALLESRLEGSNMQG